VFVFTPNPLQPGSSVSHWDVSAFPNLLMEPVINSDLTGVDLTLGAFEDIGWLPHTSPGPTPAGAHPVFVVPNPFTTSTRITFTLEQAAQVEVDIYDLRGRRIRSLPRSSFGAGPQAASWDGTDDSGQHAVAGVYLYRLHAGDHVESHRIVLLR
jgi:hypothetical protein